MAAKDTIYRVLMFPFLAHGHIYPFLELSKKLSSRNFRIFFCSTSVNLDSISDSFNNGGSPIEPVELRLPSSPELPPHYHTTRNIPPPLAPLLMEALRNSGPRFSEIIADVRPDLLIYDFCYSWAAKIAASQGIPAVYFLTGGAATSSLYHHCYIHGSFQTYPYREMWLEDYEKENQTAAAELIKVQNLDLSKFKLSCDIILVKSCRGIEGKYMDYLSSLCERKLVPTGPLIAFDESDGQESEILNWLDRKSERSTLYISFGSENYFSKGQIGEIAKGLEMTDVNFIWVIRSPIGSEISTIEALPEGFVKRMKDRGMIVQKWAPQVAILAHPSVGGFMSHCGWSSVTESMYFGVPIVALPLKIDQPANAKLVTATGAGVEVVRGEGGEFDGEGMAKAINEVFGEEREDFRRRVEEMSEKMKMEEEEDIGEVADELSRICAKWK